MLGMAAMRSSRETIGRRNLRGAYSDTNNAVQIDSGTATTSATLAMRIVPNSTAPTPNVFELGNHWVSVKKDRPTFRRAGSAL